MLLTKHLICYDADENKFAADFELVRVPTGKLTVAALLPRHHARILMPVAGDMKLYTMMHVFQSARAHLAMVVNPKDMTTITVCRRESIVLSMSSRNQSAWET